MILKMHPKSTIFLLSKTVGATLTALEIQDSRLHCRGTRLTYSPVLPENPGLSKLYWCISLYQLSTALTHEPLLLVGRLELISTNRFSP